MFGALFCASIATAAATGCKDESGVNAQTPTSTSASTGADVKGKVNGAKVAMGQTLSTILALPEISKASVEQALHVSLQHAADEPADQLSYEATLPNGPFERVTLKLPNAQQNRFLYFQLVVRKGIDLHFADFRELTRAPGARPVVGSPSPSARNSIELPHPKGYVISYSFMAATDRLTSIHVNIKAPAQPS